VPAESPAARLTIFGGIDGLTMFLGLVAGVIISRQSNDAIWHAALGGAMGELVGMTSGQWLSDKDSGFLVALVCGTAGAVACAAPAFPFIWLDRTAATICALAIAVAIGAAVSWLRPEKGWQAIAQTYGVLIAAGVLSGLTGLILCISTLTGCTCWRSPGR